MLVSLIGNQLLRILNELLAFCLHAHAFSIEFNLLAPGRYPRLRLVSDDWSDLAQCLIFFLRNTGVCCKNNIWLCIRDCFEIKAVRILENVRFINAELFQLSCRPRKQSAAVFNAIVRCREAYRHNAECERNVMVRP
ncbi:hypothetical protein D3C84_778170 [compost metagenome]